MWWSEYLKQMPGLKNYTGTVHINDKTILSLNIVIQNIYK